MAMDASDLYGLPLERFVPERTGLAKRLRGEGHRDEAARVAKLAKPSVAAWAVNHLVRSQGKALADLFDAGESLQHAQRDVIAGRGSARALREAAERERAAVITLTDSARGLLSSEGHALTHATLEPHPMGVMSRPRFADSLSRNLEREAAAMIARE